MIYCVCIRITRLLQQGSLVFCLQPINRHSNASFQGEIVGACAMVFDVAKFLREWVVYHSKIGVEKFVLYDNDSDDDLMKVIKELNQEGYSIERSFRIWPKTQEAGRFSHAQWWSQTFINERANY
ncbi:hypothetical protein NC652_005108 [Populus alba x Populus x berolinensis]|nr:hypothetical protein NC652_005108 [Populus alba x Populus x berolinensis]